LLGKIREVGVPAKGTVQWLKTIGFTSSNDSSMLKVLEQIGFVDSSRVPGEPWQKYRGGDYKRVLGNAIRSGYRELYETYSDAHARSVTELDSFFSTHTSAGKSVRELTVRAFRTLAGIADFAGTTDDSVPVATEEAKTAIPIRAQQRSGGVTININVQLVLPDTTDEALYDRFFGAMKKHLLASDGE